MIHTVSPGWQTKAKWGLCGTRVDGGTAVPTLLATNCGEPGEEVALASQRRGSQWLD